jgi:hypothetical protein
MGSILTMRKSLRAPRVLVLIVDRKLKASVEEKVMRQQCKQNRKARVLAASCDGMTSSWFHRSGTSAALHPREDVIDGAIVTDCTAATRDIDGEEIYRRDPAGT